jgi:hypothetical protein
MKQIAKMGLVGYFNFVVPSALFLAQWATLTLSFRAPFLWREESAFPVLDHESHSQSKPTTQAELRLHTL